MVFVRDHTRSRYETNEFGFFVGYTIVDIWDCSTGRRTGNSSRKNRVIDFVRKE